MTRDFSFKNAFLYAFLIHLLLIIFLGSRPLKRLDFNLFKPDTSFIRLKKPNRKQLKFRFIDVPKSVPEQPPLNRDTQNISDRQSRASGEKKNESEPVEIRDTDPYSKGNTKEQVMDFRPPRGITEPVEEEQTVVEREPDVNMNNEESPDGALVVRNRDKKAPAPEPSESGMPFDFMGAAQKVGDYLQESKRNNPYSDFEGVGLSFDVDFSRFGWYQKTLYRRVYRNWIENLRYSFKSLLLRETGITRLQFTIQRDGRVTDLKIYRDSGVELLDRAALNAIRASDPFPELPEDFNHPQLRITGKFEVDD